MVCHILILAAVEMEKAKEILRNENCTIYFTTTINSHTATRDRKQQSNVILAYGLDGPRISIYFPIKVRNLSLQQSIKASSVAHPGV